MADQTSSVQSEMKVSSPKIPGAVKSTTPYDTPPPKGTRCLQYIGIEKNYKGPVGSHKEITLTQFKEAGVKKPFTDPDLFQVQWNPRNGYLVATGLFTKEALDRLLKEDDLTEVTA